MLSQLRKYVRFRRELAQLLSMSLSLEECERIVRQRLECREENFLGLLQRNAYQNPRSPYGLILRDAGIAFEDVKQGVQSHGIEKTLQQLFQAGVYLSFEEYKGREPLVRRGKTYPYRQQDLYQHAASYEYSTGGSTGASTRIPQNLSAQLDHAVDAGLRWKRLNPPGTQMALWRSEPPAANFNVLIRMCLAGHPPDAWFTPLPPHAARVSWQQRLLFQTVLSAIRKRGISLPKPHFVALSQAHRIAEWIVRQKQAGATCVINCNVSNAVRVCEAARKRGLDIRNTRFQVLSEPLTPAKQREIQNAGAIVSSVYSAVDAGRLGTPCESPNCADDMHVPIDTCAIITRRRPRPGTQEQVDSFLVSTLRATNPLYLLNVEFDDYGVLEERDCGCYFAKLGFPWHISHVRSFSKLTTYGTTVPLADVAWVLEQTLPQRFGGASIHYQLLEENSGSQTRLTLVVSPHVGPLEERMVLRTFIQALQQADARLVEPTRLWEASGALRVVRQEPLLTPRGKLMPVRILREDERGFLPS